MDHKPNIIHPLGILERKQRPWRFEQMWLKDDGCHDVVKATWRRAVRGSPMAMVEGKINMCQLKFKWWSKQHFGNITRALLEKKSLLKKAEVAACGNGFMGRLLV